MFRDIDFTKLYIKELLRVSDSNYFIEIFSELDNELSNILKKFYKENMFFSFEKHVFLMNQKYIRGILNPKISVVTYSKYNLTENKLSLSIGNAQTLPIELIGVYSKNFNKIIPLEKEIILEGKKINEVISFNDLTMPLSKNFGSNNLQIAYKIIGIDSVRFDEIDKIYPNGNDLLLETRMKHNSNINEFEFVINKDNKITFLPGDWVVNEDIIIPAGFDVLSKGGFNLDLKDSSKLISYSPINFLGSDEYPINIYSSDSTGSGVCFINVKDTSIINNVSFSNLSNYSKGIKELTGAITTYESNIIFNHCRFESSKAEDAINFVRSNFQLNHCVFSNSISDAIDSDFSNGRISNSIFINTGNDAIDLSGSNIIIDEIMINNCGDKGISVGENSQAKINRASIENVRIGIASKDHSNVEAKNITMNNAEVGITAFRKKSEFGPSKIFNFKL